MKRLFILFYSFVLTGCALYPPQPPMPDSSDRVPINSFRQQSPIIKQPVNQGGYLAPLQPKYESKASSVMVAPPVQTPAFKGQDAAVERRVEKSSTVTVNFPFKGVKFRPSPSQVDDLLARMHTAKHILIRGRTDANNFTFSDETYALKRSLAARKYLIKHGVSPLIVFVNFLSGDDYLSDNTTKAGRALNRRVDIEFISGG